MKRYAAIIILVLFLGLALAIFGIFRSEGSQTVPASTAVPVMATAYATATPLPTSTPSPTPLPTMPPTPSPTPSPSPTAVPTSTPEATASPSPTPTSVPGATATTAVNDISGSFRSDTGTFLNLIVKYSIKQNGDNKLLCLYAYAESYGLETVKRLNDLCFKVDGTTLYVSTGPILVTDNSLLSETLLGTVEIDVLPSSTVRADVTWAFNGVMGGEQLNTLSASATISIP